MHDHPLTARDISEQTARVPSTALDRWALARVQRIVKSAPIQFALWDDFVLPPHGGPPVATIRFKSRGALLSWVWNPDLNFGETYMSGAVEISGDLVGLLEAIYRALPPTRSRAWWEASAIGRIPPWLLRWIPRRAIALGNDVKAARDNVHHHYDLGNDFYRLWLDREMVYTCAYFPTPDDTLDDAQVAKMAHVCRKLRLTPGEKVIEVGCGWGSLALFMAEHYGVSVKAFNISSEQIAFARARADKRGLADRVEFVEDDYRNARGQYDAFVSVGMLEHVGLPDYPTLGCVIGRTLGPNGRGLLHFIGRDRPAPLNPWIRKRIFPGAYPPTLREVFAHILEPQSLSVLDVENLRLHYAKTLEHWLRRYNDASAVVADAFDDAFVRAWRLYLAGSQAAFTTAWMQLFQVVFARRATNEIPWTRAS